MLYYLQSLLDFPPILTNLTPASQPQAMPSNSFPAASSSFPKLGGGVTYSTAVPQIPGIPTLQQQQQQQPFVLPPPPSFQKPVMSGFGATLGAVRQPSPVLPTTNTAKPIPIPNKATPATTATTSLDLLGDLKLNLTPTSSSTGPILTGSQGWGAFQGDPLAVLNDLTVPKDKIQPSKSMKEFVINNCTQF